MAGSLLPQRLGKNIGGYRGESIDIAAVLRDIEAAIVDKNWSRDRVPVLLAPGGREVEFVAYRRSPAEARHRLYLSTGIHGDEPAGPLAVRELMIEDQWPGDTAIWLCPCLNLTGFPLNRRENELGVDLNRDYRHLAAEETRVHTRWLGAQPSFDIALCLHEDWESQGFYVYEVNPDGKPSLAERIIDSVEKVCPIDRSPLIENWPASGGIIRPAIKPEERPQWAEALYLITNKTRLSYTMEAPSDFPLDVRVNALVTAARAVFAAL